jgi:hypothetical protein
VSGDEVLVLVASVALGPVAWALWFWRLSGLDATRRRRPALRALGVTLAACTAVLLLVLRLLAAHDVRDSLRYTALYLLLGLAWVRGFERCLPWFGLSTRDDVVERGNAAALPAVAGFLGALTLAYAGGNIGDGPGWWVVVACSVLATLGVLLAWLLLESASRVSEHVTVERDLSAGFRLGGFLLACGAVAGRAVAGDWISAEATVSDFVHGAWPLAVLVAVAALVERAARPRPERTEPSPVALGVLPALAYLALAGAAVAAAGRPA